MDDDTALKSTARGATYNIGMQMLFRGLTFVINAMVLRLTTSATVGIVNVRLTLLHSTVLFLAREPFRKTCLGVSRDDETRETWAGVINLAWMAVPTGTVVSLALGMVWIRLGADHDGYDDAVMMYCIASVVELCSEPLWILGQTKLYIKTKILAEGLALSTKCAITLGLLLSRPEMGLYAFSAAQLGHSLVLSTVYFIVFWLEIKRGASLPIYGLRGLFPQTLGPQQPFFPRNLVAMSLSFFKQSVLKQLLTEGEGFLMTFLGILTLSEQGVYSVVNNLGSLVARFLFSPIEETFYTFFAGILRKPNITLKEQKLSRDTLQTLLSLVFRIGVTIAVFAQGYAAFALDLYGGTMLSEGDGPLLLKAYSVYVAFMAVNGITECFMFAAMSPEEVERHNLWLLGFSGCFIVAAWGLTLIFGSIGFILANCVNMTVRTARSSYYITGFFGRNGKEPPFWQSLPSFSVICTLAATLVITKWSETFLTPLVHLSVGVGAGLVLLGTILTEQQFVSDLIGLFRGQSSNKIVNKVE